MELQCNFSYVNYLGFNVTVPLNLIFFCGRRSLKDNIMTIFCKKVWRFKQFIPCCLLNWWKILSKYNIFIYLIIMTSLRNFSEISNIYINTFYYQVLMSKYLSINNLFAYWKWQSKFFFHYFQCGFGNIIRRVLKYWINIRKEL